MKEQNIAEAIHEINRKFMNYAEGLRLASTSQKINENPSKNEGRTNRMTFGEAKEMLDRAKEEQESLMGLLEQGADPYSLGKTEIRSIIDLLTRMREFIKGLKVD